LVVVVTEALVVLVKTLEGQGLMEDIQKLPLIVSVLFMYMVPVMEMEGDITMMVVIQVMLDTQQGLHIVHHQVILYQVHQQQVPL